MRTRAHPVTGSHGATRGRSSAIRPPEQGDSRIRRLLGGTLLGVLLLVSSSSARTAAADDSAGATTGAVPAHIDVYDHLAKRAAAPVRHVYGFDLLEPLDGRIGSRFGPRLHPILGFVRIHHGVDVGARTGTPVRSAEPGKVIRAGDAGAYGNLSKTLVDAGATVLRGQTIGEVGNTGLSTGPHLHFELRVDGVPVDPAPWLPALQDR